MEGFLCIDKPCGPTSFSVVEHVRRVFRTAKVGHAGTLDPAASGLLIVALGSATRLLPFLPLEPKRYHFGIQFGAETDTLDTQGSITNSGGPIPAIGDLEAALPGFTGTITQTPPEFSAVKVGGERAYRLARRGHRVTLSSRPVTITALWLKSFDQNEGRAMLEVTCSGGTYVRSLARDVAIALGTFGHAFAIRRIAAGGFHVDKAVGLEKLASIRAAADTLLSVLEAFEGMPSTTVDERLKALIGVGSDITLDGIVSLEDGAVPKMVFAYDEERRLVAVLRNTRDREYHPERVFLQRVKGEE